jgi:hypothetical protein
LLQPGRGLWGLVCKTSTMCCTASKHAIGPCAAVRAPALACMHCV